MVMPLPVGKGMFTFGAIIIWVVIINALLLAYTGWGTWWLMAWSPLFIFIGVLLVTAFISDHKVAFLLSGAVALGWWYFIVGI